MTNMTMGGNMYILEQLIFYFLNQGFFKYVLWNI